MRIYFSLILLRREGKLLKIKIKKREYYNYLIFIINKNGKHQAKNTCSTSVLQDHIGLESRLYYTESLLHELVPVSPPLEHLLSWCLK